MVKESKNTTSPEGDATCGAEKFTAFCIDTDPSSRAFLKVMISHLCQKVPAWRTVNGEAEEISIRESVAIVDFFKSLFDTDDAMSRNITVQSLGLFL
jgi:hypothetical protein